MTTLYFATSAGLGRTVIAPDTTAAHVELKVPAGPISTISVDPNLPERLYATSRGRGFWRSTDGGKQWEKAGKGIRVPVQTCSVVSAADRNGGFGAVYVGTIGPALFVSKDGGETFDEITTLDDIPSRKEWSFPPMPDIAHVQSLATDVTEPSRIFVGIEVGGIMRSEDGGKSWSDHPEGADADPHVLLTHPLAPGRVYEGGGGAYAETRDGGASWHREVDGFADEVRYFYSIAVDPEDPDTVLMASGRDHVTGHRLIPGVKCWATLYRKRKGREWHELRTGLPDREDQEMGYLANDGATPGEFFYTTVDGRLFVSRDHGDTWSPIALTWPEGLEKKPTISRLTAVRG